MDELARNVTDCPPILTGEPVPATATLPDGIVILSPFPWRGVWHTLHYVAVHLSQTTPVIYVNPPPLWDPRARGFHLGSLLSTRPRMTLLGTTLRLVTPLALPLRRLPVLRRASDRLYAQAVHKACAAHGVRHPLFWVTYYPGVVRHLSALRAERSVYHCLDYFDNVEETQLAQRADIVLAVSRPLVKRLRPHNERTRLLPNGVAVDWAKAHSTDGTTPPSSHSRRRLGFVGTLNRNVDFVLLEKIARATPSVDLEIIGPVASGPAPGQQHAFASLKSIPTVRFLGFRPPQQLFDYIARHDACLLPFLTNEWIAHSDPLKFYQYLALGKPVIATAFPAALRYHRICYVAESHEAFLKGVAAALDEPHLARAAARQRIAAAHDWGRVVPRALQIVTHALRAKARAIEAVPVAHGQGRDVTLLPVSSATPRAQRRS